MARLAPLDGVQGGRDDAGGGAGTPDGAATGRCGRTSDSADRIAGAGRPGRRRRVGSSSRPAPPDHRRAVRVNRDASLSVAAPASAPSGRRATGGHDGLLDNVVQPAGSSVAEPAGHRRRRSRSDRGRSNCKRSPGGGNRRTGTDGPIAGRPVLGRRHGVDERHRRQDSRPACVPSTMWGTAPMQNLQVVRGAVLTPKSGRPLLRRPPGGRALSSPEHERSVTDHATSLKLGRHSRGHAVR
jgi:hypothetical protein